MAVVAMYHYHRYTQCGQPRSLWLAMLFLTLAALTRTTFLISVASGIGYGIYPGVEIPQTSSGLVDFNIDLLHSFDHGFCLEDHSI